MLKENWRALMKRYRHQKLTKYETAATRNIDSQPFSTLSTLLI